MNALRKTLVCLTLLAASSGALADSLVVIANRDSTVQSLQLNELVDIYMGRQQVFPDGSSVLPLDQPPVAEARNTFYQTLVNKSVAEVNAYWARLLFTGRASPPRVMSDGESVLKTVRDNRDAIGYVSADQVDDTVKVIFRIE